MKISSNDVEKVHILKTTTFYEHARKYSNSKNVPESTSNEVKYENFYQVVENMLVFMKSDFSEHTRCYSRSNE